MSGIFISYRHEGGFPTANHLADRLRNDGYNVVFDKTSLREGKFDENILEAIERCDDFIVILNSTVFDRTLSGTPVERDWLRMELAHAVKKKKNIIPVMLSGFEWPKQLPEDIDVVRLFNGPKYSRDYYDSFYEKLLTFLKSSSSKPSHLKSSSAESSRFEKSKIWKITTALLALALIGGVIFFYSFTHRPKEPVLLFAGGGSVKGYILDSINENALDNGTYMPMASTTAWPLVAEELSVGGYEDYDEQNPRPYYLVLFSAEKVDANQLMPEDSQKEFLRRIGYLVEIQIGEIPLQVAYQNVPELDSLFKQNKMISVYELKNILSNPTYNIYATTQGTSATWRRYNNILESKLDSLQNVKFFEKKDDLTSFTDSYIILESSTYFAENIRTPRLNICDSDHQIVTCPLYIYFIAYKTKGNNNFVYVVPEKVRSFLSIIGIEKFPEGDKLWYQNLIRSYNLESLL